jgi:hypothetical protein
MSEDSGQLRMVIRIRETNKNLKRAALIKKITKNQSYLRSLRNRPGNDGIDCSSTNFFFEYLYTIR